MTAILRGTGPQSSGSELDSDPRDLTAAASQFPPQAAAPAPVTMPRQATDIRLGGKRRRGGKLIGSLAALLILGGLAVAAWHFQEPIKELAKGYFDSKAKTEPPVEPKIETSPTDKPKTQPSSSEVAQKPGTEPQPGGFDPTAKTQPLPGAAPSNPPPIVLQNATTSAEPAPKPMIAQGASSILGVTPAPAAGPPPTEVKSAMRPGETTSEPVAPKATIVEEPDSKSEPAKAHHVPGTALSKTEPPAPTLVEVTPQGGSTSGAPTAPDAPSTAKSAEANTEISVQTSPEGKKAAESLKSFFAAKNLADRLPLTLGAESMKSLMERYYAKKDSGPVSVDEIKLLRYDPAPETGGGPHCVFTVASKEWEYPIPVMLQEEGGSYKVDWLAFVEFRDNLLFEFLSEYQEVPARFHVGIRRTHYFEDDVPDLEQKDCFEIQPPLPTYVGYVFVPKGTPLASDLGARISWETMTAYVIVELRWKREGKLKWVELTAVPQLNWYSFSQKPQDGTPASKSAPAKKGGGMDVKKTK